MTSAGQNSRTPIWVIYLYFALQREQMETWSQSLFLPMFKQTHLIGSISFSFSCSNTQTVKFIWRNGSQVHHRDACLSAKRRVAQWKWLQRQRERTTKAIITHTIKFNLNHRCTRVRPNTPLLIDLCLFMALCLLNPSILSALPHSAISDWSSDATSPSHQASVLAHFIALLFLTDHHQFVLPPFSSVFYLFIYFFALPSLALSPLACLILCC